jgi:hypothetical protein
MERAGRQEKLRPQENRFFLDSFYGTNQDFKLLPVNFKKVLRRPVELAAFIGHLGPSSDENRDACAAATS